MKAVALVAGILGVLVVVAAVIGRFHGVATVTFPVVGQHTGMAVMVVGNTLLLIAALLLMLRLQLKDK